MAIEDVNSIVAKTYIALKEKLNELISEGVVNTVERWNNQLINEEREHQVLPPAVYIEIIQNHWKGGNWEIRQGELNFCLHVVVETAQNFDIEDWEICQKVYEKIQGFQTPDVHNAFIGTGDVTNNNYDVVIDNMLNYRTFVNDESLLRLQSKGNIDTITEEVDASES